MRSDRYTAYLQNMTVEEKCRLLTGDGAFAAKGLPQAGIKPFRMSDGPSGVRDGHSAFCYPSASLIACSFDRNTAEAIGAMVGEDCKKRGVGLLLGPSQNLKRTPVCGRNFEYYSEDPCLSGELAGHFVRGVQKYAGACVKHYAAYNQEDLRMSVDCIIDEMTLNETYLSSFERIVRKNPPLAVMTSYNKINGDYAGENEYVSKRILREQWGYRGAVLSDWGAVDDIVKAFRCGLTLEMPDNPCNTERLIKAVHSGEISTDELDERVAQYLSFAEALGDMAEKETPAFVERARLPEIAAQCFVLLKNEDAILPLTDAKRIGVFGEFAVLPRIQGGGCANVFATDAKSPLAAIEEKFSDRVVDYARGYRLNGEADRKAEQAAIELAKRSDVCLVFLGLPEAWESEGYDRDTIRLPENQTEFLRKLSEYNKEIVVILANGGVVSMEWDAYCKGLIECYLAGNVLGEALGLTLRGDVAPSGRLAETVLHDLSDSSAFPFFAQGKPQCRYNEGLFVGYKYYVSKNVGVQYPFGYGLTYGEVSYRDIRIDGKKVSFYLKNDGERQVKEVVQIYVGYNGDVCPRPLRELKFFDKVAVPAKSEIRYETVLEDDCFYTYDPAARCMKVCGGVYEISVAKNAEDVLYAQCVTVHAANKKKFDRNSRVGELLESPEGIRVIEDVLKPYVCKAIIGNFNAEIDMKNGQAEGNPMFNSMMNNMPLRTLANLTAGTLTHEKIDAILQDLNGKEGDAE